MWGARSKNCGGLGALDLIIGRSEQAAGFGDGVGDVRTISKDLDKTREQLATAGQEGFAGGLVGGCVRESGERCRFAERGRGPGGILLPLPSGQWPHAVDLPASEVEPERGVGGGA